jgi:hypothetical protein
MLLPNDNIGPRPPVPFAFHAPLAVGTEKHGRLLLSSFRKLDWAPTSFLTSKERGLGSHYFSAPSLRSDLKLPGIMNFCKKIMLNSYAFRQQL